jgi:phage-related protein
MMPGLGPRVLELRIPDDGVDWRVIVRTDAHAIVIGAVFPKRTRTTPRRELESAGSRFARYDRQSRHVSGTEEAT